MICFMFSSNFSFTEETADTSSFIRSHTSGGVNIRLRDEYWSTFERQGIPTDNSYNFFLIRARAFVDLKFDNLMFHLMGQGVKAFDFPNDSPFGPGGLYFGASGNDTGPGNFQIGEAFISYKDPGGVYLKGGRIPIRDGAEVLYKDAKKLNWVIKKSLAIDYLENIGLEQIEEHESELLDYTLDNLKELPWLEIYTPLEGQRVGVVSFNVKGVHPHDVAGVMDEDGIAVRSGHHCTQPLMQRLNIENALRASFYLYNTKEEIDKFLISLKRAYSIFKR